MPGQQRVRQRPEPHQAAAHRPARQVERRDAARHDNVGHRRTIAVEEGRRFGHRPNIGIGRRAGYRPPMPTTIDDFSLRPMRPEDAAAVAALIRAAFAAQSVVTDPLPSALRVTEADVDGASAGRRRRRGRGRRAGWSVRRCGRAGRRAVSGAAGGGAGVARPRHRQGAGGGGRGGGARDGPAAAASLSTRLVLLDNRRLFAACGFVETTREAHPGYAEPTFVNMEKRLARIAGYRGGKHGRPALAHSRGRGARPHRLRLPVPDRRDPRSPT